MKELGLPQRNNTNVCCPQSLSRITSIKAMLEAFSRMLVGSRPPKSGSVTRTIGCDFVVLVVAGPRMMGNCRVPADAAPFRLYKIHKSPGATRHSSGQGHILQGSATMLSAGRCLMNFTPDVVALVSNNAQERHGTAQGSREQSCWLQ